MAVGLGLSLADHLSIRRPPIPTPNPPVAARPIRPWPSLLKHAALAFNTDRIPTVAAAVSFFLVLAFVPALSAFVSLYGLVTDVEDVRRLTAALSGVMPAEAIALVGAELTRLAGADHASLGLAFFISVSLSIWSASAGVRALFDGLNVAYEAHETRGFLALNAISVAAAAATIAWAAIMAWAAVTISNALCALNLAPLGMALLWAGGFVIAAAALSAMYRYAPCRPRPAWRWTAPGGVTGAAGWMAMSALFSWYVGNIGHYDRTYGSLGAVIGFLTWLWLSLMVVLFGAELNSEIEARARAIQARAAPANPPAP